MMPHPETVTVFQSRLIALFRTQGVTVKTKVSDTTLTILLEGLDLPSQPAYSQQIRTLLRSHLPLDIDTLHLYGRQLGQPHPAWQDQLSVAPAQAESDPITSPVPPGPREVAIPTPIVPKPGQIQAKGWEALIIGLVLASVLASIAPLRVISHGFLVMVHEVGHALFHWIFGEPAIPTVNILHGGGITLALGRSTLLIGLLYGGWAFLIYLCRHYVYVVGIMVGLAAVHLICLLTPVHRILTIGMGHGMEVVAIGLCLYLSASGRLCRIPGDRAIYAMLGFFTLFMNLNFAGRLVNDVDFRDFYMSGIGNGAIDNDLVILATEFFHVDLSTIAALLGGLCVAFALVPFFLVWQERRVMALLRQLFAIL